MMLFSRQDTAEQPAGDWLFWEVEPAVHFPAADGHDMTYRITFKLEGVFGHNDTANVNDGWFIRPSAPGRKSN